MKLPVRSTSKVVARVVGLLTEHGPLGGIGFCAVGGRGHGALHTKGDAATCTTEHQASSWR